MTSLWVTQDAGYFARHGLDVDFEYAQGTLAAQAMVAGQFDVGNLGASAVVASNLQGADLRIVAALSTKSIYALVVDRDVTSATQLRGARFGISRFGDAADVTTRMVLRRLGVDPETEVAFAQVGNSPERYAALVAGSIQGMVADPMDVVRARREGFHLLADQAALDLDYVSSAVTVRTPFLRDQPDTVRRLLMAIVEGIHHFKTDQDTAVAVAGKHLQSDDVEALRAGIEVFAKTLTPTKPYATESGMRPIREEVGLGHPAALDAPLDRFVDSRPLEAIDRAGFIDALYR
jgi:NitT/TauT family transport system substrate-binding protein